MDLVTRDMTVSVTRTAVISTLGGLRQNLKNNHHYLGHDHDHHYHVSDRYYLSVIRMAVVSILGGCLHQKHKDNNYHDHPNHNYNHYHDYDQIGGPRVLRTGA